MPRACTENDVSGIGRPQVGVPYSWGSSEPLHYYTDARTQGTHGRGRRAATDPVSPLFVSFSIFGLLQGIAFALDAFIQA